MPDQPNEPDTELQAEWTEDAIVEPPNSTVDDWIGQRTTRDAARADQALEEAGGDEAKAEQLFEQRTERRDDEPIAEAN